ncbi:MAG: hypothetical protein IJA34_15385 [Lachnospiraceae bacterium]|nr:hypothetical protein [Lachnospiraceae bacterium]
MGYAIVGYFDKETDEKIRGLWKNLMLKEVDDYLYNSENNPHIKFAMYETLEEEQVIDVIRNIAEQTKTMNIVFKSYSFYPNEQPFLNIDMAVGMELLRLQSEIREKCDKFSKLLPIDFFDKGIWKPDCQLTREIDKSKLIDAVNCLYETKLPIKGRLVKIGLIKFHPAKQIANFNLNI